MRRVLIGGLLLATLGAISACAQGFNLSFTSKSPFYAGNASLPAGTYKIQPNDPSDSTFEITSASGQEVYFEGEPTDVTPTETGITFQKYGTKLYLKSFGISGVQSFIVPVSIPEKQSKKGGAKPTKVATPATKS